MELSLKGALFTLLFTTVIAGGKHFRNDYKFYTAADGWLKFHEVPTNWNEARIRCHMEGAILASPLTLLLKYAMTTLTNQTGLTGPFYTGVHATFSNGDYFSLEGTPISQIPHIWVKGEPDNVNNEENCLILKPDGTMGDRNCKKPFPYMCYKKYTGDLVVNSCGTIDPEYNFDARTGSCYKFHKVLRTWARAHMTCAAEGGHLAIINSENEATVLKELFAKNPGDYAYIGFHDWGEKGEWRTIHGQTLQEAGYNKFSQGQPDNASPGEHCGSISKSGMLNDLWCNKFYGFICEKNPASLTCSDSDEDLLSAAV